MMFCHPIAYIATNRCPHYEIFRKSWGDRFGKARVFVEGHEVMVKRYSFMQQLTFSHDAYHISVDNTALGPLHGCNIHIRVAAQLGLHLMVCSCCLGSAFTTAPETVEGFKGFPSCHCGIIDFTGIL